MTRNAPLKVHFLKGVLTLCGLKGVPTIGYEVETATVWKYVTCKNCLRAQARHDRGAVR